MHDSDFDLTQPMLAPDRPVFGGRYILQALLGTGGMGTVWRALDVSLRREIALKFLPLSITRDEQAREDLKKEVLLSQELTHPNIIRVHNFEEDHMLAAISMELVEGKSLYKLKMERANSIFSVFELTPWVEQLCGALGYAHKLNIIHRDLKPGNIMLSTKGQVKVVDFGIAASVSEATTRTAQGPAFGFGGTLSYMSPQQALGEKPTAADDLYSLGATLYECLAGKPPFFRGDVYAQILHASPPPMNSRLAEIDPQLLRIPNLWDETILACLAKNREDRPASAEVVAALLIRGEMTTPLAPGKPPELTPRSPSKSLKQEVLVTKMDDKDTPVAQDRPNPWERVAIAFSLRVDIYRKVFGLEGKLTQRIGGVIGTLALLGFIEVFIINTSGFFAFGGWLHSNSAFFKMFNGWASHVFRFWNAEKTAVTFFVIFLALQALVLFAIKRSIGFGRVSIISRPEGVLVQTSYGKNLGRTPLLLRGMLPGRYRFRLILSQDKQVDISGLLSKNRTLQLSTPLPHGQKSASESRG